METLHQSENCYDIARGLDRRLRDIGVEKYFVAGGMAAEALRDEDTKFDIENRQIIAGVDLDLPSIRHDGTRRDLDILILTEYKGLLNEAKTEVEKLVKDKLEVSVFGISAHEQYASPRQQLVRNFTEFLSERTIDSHGAIRYVLGPIEVVTNPASFEPWQLVLPDGEAMQVMHPVGQMLCYAMRSISGIRPKDRDKLSEIADVLLDVPEFRDAAINGEFKEWMEFIVLRDKLLGPEAQAYFPETSRAELFLARTKGKLLHALESNPKVVTIGLDPRAQKLLKVFVRHS